MEKGSLCIVFICSIFFLDVFGCKKSSSSPGPALPPITQTGANTFGCKVNGKVWVPYWPCADLVAGDAELTYNIRSLNPGQTLPLIISLAAGNINSGNSFFNIQQNYTLNDHIYGPGNIYDSVLIRFLGNPGGNYMNYLAQPGETASRYLQITKLDTVNKIISGVFAFTLYASNDSIVVTEGRFDLKIDQFERCTQ